MSTGVPWPTPSEAEARVLRMQTKLHQWATDDRERRFVDLFNLVADPAFLLVAWRRVRGNRGARSAGIDGQIHLWDPAGASDRGSIPASTAPLNAVVFSRDGKLLGAAGDDKMAHVFDAKSHKALQKIEPAPDALPAGAYQSVRAVQVLPLRGNLGHQRAIATGLAYIYDRLPCDAVVVMDADGEDLPSDVVRLLRRMTELPLPTIVFAERSKRSERPLFVFFYHVYRLLHVILTGKGIRVGNFSVVPYSLLGGVVVDPNLWNHYAAAVWISKASTDTIRTERGKRLHGRSKFGFTSLVVHGLSAISCYNEVMSVRLLMFISVGLLLVLLSLAVTAGIRLFTDLAVPGWATYTTGLLGIAFMQLVMFAGFLTMTLLGSRRQQPFIPLRDYGYFVGQLRELYRYGR